MRRLMTMLAAVLIVGSCAKNTQPSDLVSVDGDGKVTITFSASFPAMPLTATKAMGEEPTLQSLYLAVFGPSGALNEYVQATQLSGPDANRMYTFKASIYPVSGPATIHFLGNGPSRLDYGFEESLMSNLTKEVTDDPNDGYWQRRVFPDGISSDTPTSAFGGIVLIRNYCKLSIRSSSPNFQLEGYEIVNTPVICHTALYIGSHFVDDYQNMDISAVRSAFNGLGWNNLRFDTQIKSDKPQDQSSADVIYGTSFYQNTPKFMYQRSIVSTITPTYMIAKGRYTRDGVSTECYYRINLTDEHGYIPLFRNFHYEFDITDVRTKGADTPLGAAQSSGSGDIIVDVLTTFDSELSDGAARLKLGYTERTFTSGGTNVLPVEYYPASSTGGQGTVMDNSKVKFLAPDGVSLVDEIPDGPVVSGGRVIGSRIEYGVKNPTSFARQIVTVVAEHIHETVTFYSQAPLDVSVRCVQKVVTAGIGEIEEIEVGIPNDLYRVIFPLTLNLSVTANSLSPDKGSGLSVVTDEDPTSETGSFSFRYVLSYDEYFNDLALSAGKKVKTFRFITTKENSASEVVLTTDKSNEARDSFTNRRVNGVFSNLNFIGYDTLTPSSDLPVNFSYTTSTIADVSVKLGPGLEPVGTSLRLLSTDADGSRTYFVGIVSSGAHTLALKTTASYGNLPVTLSSGYMSVATYPSKSCRLEGVSQASETVAFNTTSFPDKRNWNGKMVKVNVNVDPGTSMGKHGMYDDGYYMRHNSYHYTDRMTISVKNNTIKLTRIDFTLSKNQQGLKVENGVGSISNERSNSPYWTGYGDNVEVYTIDNQGVGLTKNNVLTSAVIHYSCTTGYISYRQIQ